ncbi:unnamed protein product (mitochondrion) [Plasmodiophora brassicae]|uniref:Reverse transcriptase n=1 Tax=Plasmodiophora brassicae TaxID=37360 RepID=A0A3P3YG00_PLABS|nr:unnamed protein product [Plasmodiophora brassicae]
MATVTTEAATPTTSPDALWVRRGVVLWGLLRDARQQLSERQAATQILASAALLRAWETRRDATFEAWLDTSPCDRTPWPPFDEPASATGVDSDADDDEIVGAAAVPQDPACIDVCALDIDAFLDAAAEDGSACYAVHTMWTPLEEPDDSPHLPDKYAEFTDVFDETGATSLPAHRPYDCCIDLKPGMEPPFGRLYGLSPREQVALKQYLKANLESGFIRPSKSSAGAPILFAKKKDGSLRLCVDYRGLNAATVKNRYPIPLIDQILAQLSAARVFTKIDLRGAYNQIRIRDGDEWKTAFRTPYGLFEYLVMPFGLSNGPAAFQGFMNDLFRDYVDVFVVVYLDDILVFSRDAQEHERHVKLVLDRLRQANLSAKLSKCSFDAREVEFLGYVISAAGVRLDQSRVDTILAWEPPKDANGVRVFLGFANFYRKFIPHFGEIALPLTNLTREDVAFRWTDREQDAFRSLQAAFTSAPVLAHFHPDRPCEVETDASDFAIAMVLSQRDADDELRPLAFYSRKLTKEELNYKIHDKEMLAIVQSFEKWRQFLDSAQHQTLVHSDHRNLEYFLSTQKLSRRQARWSELLGEFDFRIQHRPGRLHGKADALSRRPEYQPSREEEEMVQRSLRMLSPDHFLPGPLGHTISALQPENSSVPLIERIRRQQATDAYVAKMKALVDTPKGRRFRLIDGLLYRDHRLIVVGDDCKLEILQTLHDSPAAGHLGLWKTLRLVQREFWWCQLRSYVKDYVASCDTCRRCKIPRHKPAGLLTPLPLPTALWSSISMDFIVKLPRSIGFDSILVVVDRFSKMAHFIPCNETTTAAQLADLFLCNIFRLHGLPTDIVSDRGPQFISKFWKQLLNRLGVQRNLSSARHPESDGQTERVNQTLEQYLRTYVNFQQDDWASWLPIAEFAYNDACHSSTGMSPFFANYGYHPAFHDLRPRTSASSNPSADERAEFLHTLRTVLKQNLSNAIHAMKRFADARRSPHPSYKPGDLVMLRKGALRTGRPCDKLDVRMLGPYPVVKVINAVAYELELPPTCRIHNVFHASLLEPYVASVIPGRHQPPPDPIVVDGEAEPLYLVNNILDSSRDIIHLLFQACGLDTCSAFRYWKCRHDLQDEKTALSTFKALRRDLVSAETIEDFVVQAGRDILNEAVDVPGVLAERSVVQNLGDLIPKIPRRNALSVFKTDEGWTIRSSAHHPMEKLIQDPETNERLKRSVLRLRLVCPRDRPLLLYA